MATPDSGEGRRDRSAEIPPILDLYEVRQDNWEELYAQGYRHVLNVERGGMSLAESSHLMAFLIDEIAGGKSEGLLYGAPFDLASGRPLDHRKGAIGYYVKRPPGWTPANPADWPEGQR